MAFAPGANTLVVKALGPSGVLAKEQSHIWQLGTPANLGLSVSGVGSGDAQGIRVDLGQKVGQIRATVNGHPIRVSLSPEPGSRTVTLGAADGIVAGLNTVEVTAVTDDGSFQRADAALELPPGTPLAGAGDDEVARTGVPVRLDATTSRAGESGGKLSYHWSVERAPAGAHVVLTPNADAAQPTFTADRRGTYVLRVHVSQPSRLTTADDVTVSEEDSTIPPIGSLLQTQLASVNGVALDGGPVVGPDGTRASLPSGQKGAALVLLDRRTLEILGVYVSASMDPLLNAVNTITPQHTFGVIAVLSSPNGIGAVGPAWEPLMSALGVDNVAAPWAWDRNVQVGNPFSVVSVIRKLGDTEVWRSNHSTAAGAGQLPESLSGYLQLSNGGVGANVFVPDTYLPIDTSVTSTATSNTMNVGACSPNPPPHSSCTALASPSITVCKSQQPTGGFHVVVFDASTLDVAENAAFATNSGCGNEGAELTAMRGLLGKYPPSDGTNDHVVAIQSIRAPRPQSSALDAAWLQLAGLVAGLGGTATAVADLGLGSGYSLIGSNALALPGTDQPSGVETSGDAPRLNATARLAATLAPNHRGDLAPKTRSVGGPMGNGFSSVAYAPPTPWPVPCGGAAAACPTGSTTAGQLQALYYVTNVTARNFNWDTEFRIGPPRDGPCWQPGNPTLRVAYCDTGISANEWDNFAGELCVNQVSGPCEPAVPPPDHPRFTTADWNAVVVQLSKEMAYVGATKRAIDQLTSIATFVSSGVRSKFKLQNAQNTILKELNLNQGENNASTSASTWVDLASDFTGVLWAVLGGMDPATGAVVGTVSEVLGAAGDLTDTTGQSGGGPGLTGRVDTTAQDVIVDMQHRYGMVRGEIGWLGEMVVTDWGKLANIGQADIAGGADNQLNNIKDSTAIASLAWMEPIMVSAAYQPTPLNLYTDTNCFTVTQCATNAAKQVPYSGDANAYSCSRGYVGPGNYFPWNLPDGDAQYLALPPSGPPARYVLTYVPKFSVNKWVAGNPSDYYSPSSESHPPTPPGSVLDGLFSKLISLDRNQSGLGLFKPDFYEHTLTLGVGNTVACSDPETLYGPGMAAVPGGPGGSNVYYLTQQSPRTLTNVYEIGGRWNGPGPMGGNPDGSSALAASPSRVYFHQGKQLVNDWYASGWQGPAPLPGSPDSNAVAATSPAADNPHVFFMQNGKLVNDYFSESWQGPGELPGKFDGDTPLAAASGAPGQMNLFFFVDGRLANDWYTPAAGWQGPAPLPGSPDKGSPLTAVSDATGSIHVFFVQRSLLVNDYYSPSSGWQGPGPLIAKPDNGSGIAAFARGPGELSVVASVGRALVADSYSPATGWVEAPLLYPR
ncbi:MAG: hypothetical protein JO086_05130 [Acidimicrobiia bacterium]|nr:hypothetical protein [Acidimicrobiia bacterium]